MSAGNPFASVSEGAAPNLETLGEVLITGGAGFLGRYLANALAASGNSVTVLDDLSCSNSTFDCAELRHERISCVGLEQIDQDLGGRSRPVDEVDGTDRKSRIQYQKPLKAIFLPVTKLIGTRAVSRSARGAHGRTNHRR